MKLAINKKIFVGAIIIFLLFAYCLLFIDSVKAQSFGELSDSLANLAGRVKDTKGGTIKKADLPTIVGGILYGVLGFLGVLCLVIIIYAGIKWTMAGGNQETVASARKTIQYAIIGVIVILGAYAASIYIIEQVLTVTEPSMTSTEVQGGIRGTLCQTNTDCPKDFECNNGRCEPVLIGLVGACDWRRGSNFGCTNAMTQEDCINNFGGVDWRVGETCP